MQAFLHKRRVLFFSNGLYNITMNKRAKNTALPLQRTSSVTAAASIVTVLSVLERGLGFLYRIVLSRLIGAEGLGLYQVALSVFAVFLTLGTGGLPTSVSRFISKSNAENSPLGAKRAVSSGLFICLLLTLPVCIVMGLFGQYFPFLFADTRCIQLFKLLLTGLSFSALYAVFRGYFWGRKQFVLPSLLEIAEETVMVIVGVLLLQNVQGSMDGATKAVYAVIISYAFSFTASTISFFANGGKLTSPTHAFKPIIKATAPITAVRVSGSFINSAVAVLLPTALIRAGVSQSEAMKAFGVVSGMAVPVLFIPSTVIGSIALVLVPRLTEDFYRKNTKRLYENVRRGIRVTFFIACLLLPFFLVLGDDVGLIAFANASAGAYIRAGAPILIPLSLTMITTSALNAMGFERKTFIFYFISESVLLLCVGILPAYIGVYAYLVGMGLSYLINTLCNLVFLHKQCPNLFCKKRFLAFRDEYKSILIVFLIWGVGALLSPICNAYLGEMLSTLCLGIIMLACSFAGYIAFGILPIKKLVKKQNVKRVKRLV